MTGDDSNEKIELTPAEDKPAGKFLSDRAKQIGRDGAYLEVQVRDLLKANGDETLGSAKMLVLTECRLDVTEPGHVMAVKGIVEKVAGGEYDDDLGGMDDEQKSFFVFRRIFETGLLAMAEACDIDIE